MCGVSNLDDTGARRGPGGLGVAPQQLEVNDSVWRSDLDEVFEDRCPLVHFHAGHLIHALQHFFGINSVAPALLFRTSDLQSLALTPTVVRNQNAYIVVHDPDHYILARQCQCVC